MWSIFHIFYGRLFLYHGTFPDAKCAAKIDICAGILSQFSRRQTMEKQIYLQLADGSCFAGKPFGAPLSGDVIAEVVFTTAMTGYIETLTDPSYYGQMVVQTFPLIGNYGTNTIDFESSKIHLSAYITKEWCDQPSNFRCQSDLDSWLKKEGIPGIYGIDTRALTKKIRTHGVMNGRLTLSPPSSFDTSDLESWYIKDAVSSVSCQEMYDTDSGLSDFHVVLWDFGAKKNILRKLLSHNCKVTVVPSHTSCEEILNLHPDGIMLSNGPGNPKDNMPIVEELKKLCAYKIPIFGICLGHQLLALANGADTEKLKYGHRGANQPVSEHATGRIFITSQNHGYAVKSSSIPESAEISFSNLNDDTCEGISYKNFPGFSVQFHPEACGGPHDTEYLFDQFIAMMERSVHTCH